MAFMTIFLTLLSFAIYAICEHWTGGARLFRGKKNAELAERYAQTNGKEGKQTWYWDRRAIPYVIFGTYTLTLALVFLGINWFALFVAAYLSGGYYWFRGQSPREVFPAGNGQTPFDVLKGQVAGGLLGFKGLAPAALVGALFNPLLILTVVFGVPLGYYHTLAARLPHGKYLFRSYAELAQGGFIIWPFILIHLWVLQ